MNKLQEIESAYLRSDIPDFRAGDTVKVHVKVSEGDKQRIQLFQGVVIGRQVVTVRGRASPFARCPAVSVWSVCSR